MHVLRRGPDAYHQLAIGQEYEGGMVVQLRYGRREKVEQDVPYSITGPVRENVTLVYVTGGEHAEPASTPSPGQGAGPRRKGRATTGQ